MSDEQSLHNVDLCPRRDDQAASMRCLIVNKLPSHQSNWIFQLVELKVNFVTPAKPGLLKAKGRIIHKGKRIAVGESEVKDQHRKLIAKGLVTYMILTNRKRPKLGSALNLSTNPFLDHVG